MTLSLHVLGIEGRVETVTQPRENQEQKEKREANERYIQHRLDNDREIFFDSDKVKNLKEARINLHDNKSISWLRRWWDRKFTKGNLTIVSEAFNRGENFKNFTSVEKTAFENLNDDDKITLIQDYLNKLKIYVNKKITNEKISLRNTTTVINSEITKLTSEQKKLDNKINGLKGKSWNLYRLQHAFKNDEERNKLEEDLSKKLLEINKQIGNKSKERRDTIDSTDTRIKEFRDNFDKQIKTFTDEINPLLKDMKLRFNVVTDRFEVHKKNISLVQTNEGQPEITLEMQQAAAYRAEQESQREAQIEAQRAAEALRERELTQEDTDTPGSALLAHPPTPPSDRTVALESASIAAHNLATKIIDIIKTEPNSEVSIIKPKIELAITNDPYTKRKANESDQEYQNRIREYFKIIIPTIAKINESVAKENNVKESIENALNYYLSELNRLNDRMRRD